MKKLLNLAYVANFGVAFVGAFFVLIRPEIKISFGISFIIIGMLNALWGHIYVSMVRSRDEEIELLSDQVLRLENTNKKLIQCTYVNDDV